MDVQADAQGGRLEMAEFKEGDGLIEVCPKCENIELIRSDLQKESDELYTQSIKCISCKAEYYQMWNPSGWQEEKVV